MTLLPEKEKERIHALQRYEILDTPPDGAFDRITALAAKLFKVPIAIVSLVDTDRIWFKSHHGLDVQEIDRVPGLCASVILNDANYVLTDARIDPRSLTNPLVAGEFGLRFYAGVPLKTHDGYNLGVLNVIDFEPRTVTEEELAVLSTLGQVVMDEMELRLASRKIAEQDKAKSDLLAAIGKEIRMPMTDIMGMASLLHTSGLSEEQKEWLEIINKSGGSLLTMVDNILGFARMESGELSVNLEPIDIHASVKRVLESLSGEAGKKGIILNSKIDPNIPDILIGDGQKIKQVLINLIENAIKFTNEGEVFVVVNLNSIEENIEFANLSFSVKDTGIGMPQYKLHQLFHSFTRLHSFDYKGMGLGLFICKKVVELMDGRIWLEETNENGSTFTFEIRLPYLIGPVS
jgi:signal transduction histidine kinase